MIDGKDRKKKESFSKLDFFLVYCGIFTLLFYMCLIPQMDVISFIELINIGFIISGLLTIVLSYVITYMTKHEIERAYDIKQSMEYEALMSKQIDESPPL